MSIENSGPVAYSNNASGGSSRRRSDCQYISGLTPSASIRHVAKTDQLRARLSGEPGHQVGLGEVIVLEDAARTGRGSARSPRFQIRGQCSRVQVAGIRAYPS